MGVLKAQDLQAGHVQAMLLGVQGWLVLKDFLHPAGTNERPAKCKSPDLELCNKGAGRTPGACQPPMQVGLPAPAASKLKGACWQANSRSEHCNMQCTMQAGLSG